MKRIYTLLIAVTLISSAWAQSPEKMSYQAVIRDAGNSLITSQNVGMQISVLQASVNGSPVFVERHTSHTNDNGMVTVEIGDGTAISGNFADIDWTSGPYFLKAETDPAGGTNYSITGVSQLLSVPYALHAKTAESVANVSISGSETAFNGWDKDQSDDFDGQYNSLSGKPTTLSSFTNDAGFLTSFTEVDGSISNELQTLSVSGNELTISSGNTVSLSTGASTLGALSDAITSANTMYLGSGAGGSASGSFSLGLGQETLKASAGNGNTALGYRAMMNSTSGDYNTAVGDIALGSMISGAHNVALGVSAGYDNTTGSGNIFIGFDAGRHETGSDKLYIDNSSSSSPLIGGDFSANEVTINGKLGIGASSGSEQLYVKAETVSNAELVDFSLTSPVQDDDALNLHFGSAPSSGNAQFIEASVGSTVNFKVNHTGAIYSAGGIDSNGDINAYANVSIFGNVKTDLNIEENISVLKDINVTGEVHGHEDPSSDMKAYAYGYVMQDGSIYTDESTLGFTVTRESTGYYKIRCNGSGPFIYIITPDNPVNEVFIPKIATMRDNYVNIYNLNGNHIDSAFYLLIYKK